MHTPPTAPGQKQNNNGYGPGDGDWSCTGNSGWRKTRAPQGNHAARNRLDRFCAIAYRPEGGDENIAILFLYYHLLEMLDAVGVLIAESAPVPAELQVRAMFEALVSLSFILKADTARRAHGYLVGAFTERIRVCETLDPSTPAGQRYRQALESDPNCAWVRPETPRPEAIERLKSGLTQPGYAEVYAGYQRLSVRRPAHWYELFGGPNNLREIAREVGRDGTYEGLYGGGRYLGIPRTPFSAILSKLRREALQFDRSGILKQSPKL